MIDDPDIPQAGVFPTGPDEVRFRVWAPKAERVDLILGTGKGAETLPMEAEGRGFFGATAAKAEIGDRYAYALDGGSPSPDPFSRWQPDGVGRSLGRLLPRIVRVGRGKLAGVERDDLVIYELHVGTFTPEGTFDAVIPRLVELLELGITAIELMPVAQFPGERSWGYDGVFPFAVQNSYGGPEGLKRLVEACHRNGMAVILDVIYNHFGPEGNVLTDFGHYLTEKYKTDWGPAVNYDDRDCDPVRAMVLDNVRMWVRDYRVRRPPARRGRPDLRPVAAAHPRRGRRGRPRRGGRSSDARSTSSPRPT